MAPKKPPILASPTLPWLPSEPGAPATPAKPGPPVLAPKNPPGLPVAPWLPKAPACPAGSTAQSTAHIGAKAPAGIADVARRAKAPAFKPRIAGHARIRITKAKSTGRGAGHAFGTAEIAATPIGRRVTGRIAYGTGGTGGTNAKTGSTLGIADVAGTASLAGAGLRTYVAGHRAGISWRAGAKIAGKAEAGAAGAKPDA